MEGKDGRKRLQTNPWILKTAHTQTEMSCCHKKSQLNLRPSAEEVNFEPKQTLQSKQVKRSSHEWINKFIFANFISVVISIIRSSDK